MSTITKTAHATARGPSSSAKNALVNLRRRRTYLIDPNTQFAITRHFLFVLASACGLSVANYHVFQTMLEVDTNDGVGVAIGYGYSAAMLLISAGLLILMCVFFSHRVAGPAHKIAHAMNRMAQGNLCVRVTLRDTDLLTSLAGAVNATNRDLRTALLEVQREIHLAQNLAKDNRELSAVLRRAARQLGEFRLTEAEEVDAREVTGSRPRIDKNAA